jgi:hypothetical protein
MDSFLDWSVLAAILEVQLLRLLLRQLYDDLLAETMNNAHGLSPEETDNVLVKNVPEISRYVEELQKQKLVYCEYSCAGKPFPATVKDYQNESAEIMEKLLDEGVVQTVPITSEDFHSSGWFIG